MFFEYNCRGESEDRLRIISNNQEAGVRPASSLYPGDLVNKRKRVAIAKHRVKKRKLKARAQAAR